MVAVGSVQATRVGGWWQLVLCKPLEWVGGGCHGSEYIEQEHCAHNNNYTAYPMSHNNRSTVYSI